MGHGKMINYLTWANKRFLGITASQCNMVCPLPYPILLTKILSRPKATDLWKRH